MSALLPLIFAVPVLAALLAMLVRPLARVLGVAIPIGVVVVGVMLVVATAGGDVVVAQVGGWPGGIAITFVADLLSALMLTVSGLLVATCMLFSYSTGVADDRWFVPMVLIMSAGVYGAYLTADLFNLFVMVEVALLPSYVLMSQGGSAGRLSATRLYLVVNLSASTIFLAGLGAVYGAAGTVNIAALAGKASVTVIAIALAVILIALAVKAALVPVHTWLPASYPMASPAVTALFSGLLTKIGVYALVRILSVVYEPGPTVTLVVVLVTAASMIIGVLGALGEGTMRGVLTFHMISQVGYILVGVVLAGPIGLAAVVFYLIHHTVVKTSLFLTAGAVEHQRGTGRIVRLGGVANEQRWVAIAFLLAALSLTGIPPFSGFWAKLGVLNAAVDAGSAVVFAVALLVSIGTLMSMLKLGTGVFWGTPRGSDPDPDADADDTDDPHETTDPHGRRWSLGLVVPGLALAVLSLVVGIAPEPLLALADSAGAALADPTAYVEAVLGR